MKISTLSLLLTLSAPAANAALNANMPYRQIAFASASSKISLAAEDGQDATWNVCAHAGQEYTIEAHAVTISPLRPVAGQEIQVKVTGTNSRATSKGKVNFALKAGYLRINKDLDLCEILDDYTDIKCPIQTGDLSFTFKATIPKRAPGMNVKGTITLTDESDPNIKVIMTCFEVEFQLDGAQ